MPFVCISIFLTKFPHSNLGKKYVFSKWFTSSIIEPFRLVCHEGNHLLGSAPPNPLIWGWPPLHKVAHATSPQASLQGWVPKNGFTKPILSIHSAVTPKPQCKLRSWSQAPRDVRAELVDCRQLPEEEAGSISNLEQAGGPCKLSTLEAISAQGSHDLSSNCEWNLILDTLPGL